eukprot:403350638
MAEFIKSQLLSLAEQVAEMNSTAVDSTGAPVLTQTGQYYTSAERLKQKETINEMLFTMRLVSFICNFWTIVLSLLVIYKLADQIFKAKKKRDIKRKKLYFTSILFVSYILTLSILNQLCLQNPDHVGIFDLLMEINTLISLSFFFWQYRESISLYLDKNYIQPLMSNDQKTFQKKLLAFNTQATSHGHQDSHANEAQIIAENLKDSLRQNPNDSKEIEAAKEQFYLILLNRATTIKMFCCEKFGAIKFHKGEGHKVSRFEKTLRYGILVTFFFELLFTVIDLYLSQESRSSTRSNDNTKIQSELENFGLDVVQIVLTVITIYGLYIYQKLADKIAKRDDPFSNANMLGVIIFMIVIQKYIIEGILTAMLENADFFTQQLLVIFRQTFFAIEILFVQIPIRHNFSIEHVET